MTFGLHRGADGLDYYFGAALVVTSIEVDLPAEKLAELHPNDSIPALHELVITSFFGKQ